METVALVAGETGTLKATKGVRAVGEYITGSVLALVLVCNAFEFLVGIISDGSDTAKLNLTEARSKRNRPRVRDPARKKRD